MNKLILGISLLAFTTAAYGENLVKKSPKKCKPAIAKIQEAPAPTLQLTPTPEAFVYSFKISGETSANHYVFNMTRKNENDGKGRGTHLAVEDSRINLEFVSTYNNHDLGYLIGLTGNAEHGNNPIEENRIKVKGSWGTVLAGDTRGVSDFMAVDTLYFAGGTGGVLGNYKGVINETTGCVLKTDLLDRLTPKDQTKIIYVTPTFLGFQAGYAYIPDGSHKGEQKLASHSPSSHGIKTIHDKRLSGQNFHELALKYKMTPADKMSIDCSGSVIFGKMRDLKSGFADEVNGLRVQHGITNSRSIERNHLMSYAAGLVVSHSGFFIGTEFVNNGKSAQLKILQGANMGKVWTAGIGYKDDLNKVSLTYLSSKRNLGKIENINFGYAKAKNIALTVDRQIFPGLTIYAEGLLLNLKNSNHRNLNHWNETLNGFADEVIHSNKGKVLVTGTRIRF